MLSLSQAWQKSLSLALLIYPIPIWECSGLSSETTISLASKLSILHAEAPLLLRKWILSADLFYFSITGSEGLLCFWLEMSNQRLASVMSLGRAPSIAVRKTGGPWASHWALHHQACTAHGLKSVLGDARWKALDKTQLLHPPNNFNTIWLQEPTTEQAFSASLLCQPSVSFAEHSNVALFGGKSLDQMISKASLVALESAVSFTQRVLFTNCFWGCPE